MSFYSFKNQGNLRCPKRICCNDLDRIIEQVCIQVNKVYDSCLQQETMENIEVILCDVKPCHYEYPLTFLGCESTTTHGQLTNTCVERLPDRPNFARVRTKVHIPIKVQFEDANGKKGCGTGRIVVCKDVILYVPDESIIPFELEAVVSAVCANGEFIGGSRPVFSVDACVTIILKIVATVELLIPAFGYCQIPPCEEFSENVCNEFFKLPLFPPQLEDIIAESEGETNLGRCQ